MLCSNLILWKDAQLPLVVSRKIPDSDELGRTTWVTKHRPKIDRIACPWLIGRFIDPHAQFLFVAPSKVLNVAERFNATPFDIQDAFWSHRGEQRSHSVDALPFGIVVRVPEGTLAPEFPHWLYFPAYFNGKMSFHVGENSTQLDEPLCICMPPSLPKVSNIPNKLMNSDWILTKVEINTPAFKPSPTLVCFEEMDSVTINYNKPHYLALTFNDGRMGLKKHLTPVLPVSLYW